MAKQVSARRAFWLSHLRKWRAQGGTLKAYALANDLSVGTFYAAKSAYARGLGKNKRKQAPSSPSVTFLPVQLTPTASPDGFAVSLANGVRIEVPGTADVRQWRALLGALSPSA